jgi:aarF domain-containing kinase
MALLEEELGQPWQAIYSELSPSPIAAGIILDSYALSAFHANRIP